MFARVLDRSLKKLETIKSLNQRTIENGFTEIKRIFIYEALIYDKASACQSDAHRDTTGYKSDFNEVSNCYKSVLTQWSHLIKKLSN